MPMSLSRQQALLGEDPAFISRCRTQMFDVADDVLAEAASTPHHAARAQYAKVVMANPESSARTAAQYLARSTNVTAAGIDITDAGVVTNIDDAALLAQVSSAWNTLAGIDTGV